MTGIPIGDTVYPVCPGCGKRSYPSKHVSRKIRRRLYPGEKLNDYLCQAKVPFEWERWHFGHLQPGDRENA